MPSADSSGWRPHFTYSNAMSILALLLALVGGTSLAAGLPRNSVTSKAVKNGSLRGVDVADGALSGLDLAGSSLTGANLADGAVGASKLADGSVGGVDLANGSVGGAKLEGGAVTAADLAENVVTSPNVAAGSLQGSDFGLDTLTGRNIDESLLGKVPDAAAIAGVPGRALLFTNVLPFTSAENSVGEDLKDGTFKISVACLPGETLISGGPLEIDPTSTLVESFPKNNTWSVRIKPQVGKEDKFRVVASCAKGE